MGADAKPGGRPRRRILLVLLTVVVVAAAAAGGGLYWRHWQDSRTPEVPAGTPPQPAAITVSPQIKPVTDSAPVPDAASLRKQIAGALRDKDLGKLTGQISDPDTGKVLWTDDADEPRTPASNAKILTAAAVLLELPHEERVTTKVVQGDDGQVVLVGAGDPTLTAQPTGSDTFYTDPGRIADLAEQITKTGVKVTSVAIDTSALPGPDFAETWDRRDIAGGDITPMSALVTDGGRLRPMDEYSPRTEDPARATGQALAEALGVSAPIQVTQARVGATTLASVQSAPLVDRVGDMMRHSDNVLAEALAMELAQKTGSAPTIADGASAVLTVLKKNGFDTTGVHLDDSSGLSATDKVPAALLDGLMGAIVGPKHPKLRPIVDSLPVGGGTGTLSDRFVAGQNPGAGWVRAKTGTLTGVSSLTGIVQTADGRVLSFALMSGGTSPADARPALDVVIGKVRECGCRR